jgi:hypothetical protein
VTDDPLPADLSDEQAVDQLLKLVKPGEDELRLRVRRYDHAYDVYRATEKRPPSLEPWQSKLRVPYGMQTIDTALVNINTGKPRVIVRPRHPDSELQAKAMQVLLDYFVGEDHMVERQPLFVQQGLIYGITAAKIHWVYQRRAMTYRSPEGDVHQQPIVVRDGPTFEPWNIYDFWYEPNARDIDSARYVVLRSWLTKEQLLSQECTSDHAKDENGVAAECNNIYHNIDELLKIGPNQETPRVTAQASYLGGQNERHKGQFEILEIWTNDTVTAVGSRKVLLRHENNPYWHGCKPVVAAQTRPDLFEFQGIPETELVDHLQQAQWTLQNMVIDNLHLTVMRGITYRAGGVTNPDALVLKPRFKWAVTDHDDIKPFEVPPITQDVFNERQRLLADMQLVTGINPYISGSDLSSVDQNTATGVTALQEVASRLLRFKASMIQYKGYQRCFEMWGDMIQQFLDRKVAVEIIGPGGESSWLHIGPDEVAGHFKYTLEGSEESLSRQQERGEAVALLNAMAPLAQLGIVNFKPILEKVASAYDFPNPEALFMPQGVQPQAAPTGEQADQAAAQQGQQNGAQADQQFYNIRQPQIGDVYGSRLRPSQGEIPMDPQLAAALGRIRNF